MADTEKYDLVGNIMAYEEGELELGEIFELFGHLVSTGAAWQLQGSYGRAAQDMINDGYLTPEGELTDFARHMAEAFSV